MEDHVTRIGQIVSKFRSLYQEAQSKPLHDLNYIDSLQLGFAFFHNQVWKNGMSKSGGKQIKRVVFSIKPVDSGMNDT